MQGNPRVYKALRNELAAVLAELQRIEAGGGVNEELPDTIELIAVINIQPIVAVSRFKTPYKSCFNKRYQLLHQRLCHFILIGLRRHQPLRLWQLVF